MNTMVLLLVLAAVALVLGFVVAKWLLIVAAVLLVAGLLLNMSGRRGTRV
jgi:general stress protein CsbA